MAEFQSYQIGVRTFAGIHFTLKVYALDTINDVKCLIEEQEGIPYKQIRLNKRGGSLDDGNRTLDSYNVRQDDTLSMVILHGDDYWKVNM